MPRPLTQDQLDQLIEENPLPTGEPSARITVEGLTRAIKGAYTDGISLFELSRNLNIHQLILHHAAISLGLKTPGGGLIADKRARRSRMTAHQFTAALKRHDMTPDQFAAATWVEPNPLVVTAYTLEHDAMVGGVHVMAKPVPVWAELAIKLMDEVGRDEAIRRANEILERSNLQAELDELGISAFDLGDFTGANKKSILRQVSGAQPVAHWMPWALALLHVLEEKEQA